MTTSRHLTMMNHRNLVIQGDFNIHVNNSTDIEAGQFLDTIEALGLRQLVTSPTHKSMNTLDLVIMDELSELKSIYLKPGPYLSDHCTISVLITSQE